MNNFISIQEEIPDIILDLRYFSNNNFVGERIDGYKENIAISTSEASIALKKVVDDLYTKGYLIKIYDAYRPIRAVKHFI